MPNSTLQSAFDKVGELVRNFQENKFRYLAPGYQEAEVRKDFIDKFFMALGWDVNHDAQTNPYEQEVKVEPPVSAGGQRRADYAFFIGPNYNSVRFFVEAKKPSIQLGSPDHYFQTIRYAWNSETPIAALTNFNELHVLDCRYKPDISTALSRLISVFNLSSYCDKAVFAEIYWLFSREAVASGSLANFSKNLPKPKGKVVQRGLFAGGYQSIDEAFLEELDSYRITLAKAFKDKNPLLDGEILTELIQRTLDRLVFIRFLEDKGIEPSRMVENFGGDDKPWQSFIATCRRLDSVYNGIVFKRHPLLDNNSFEADEPAFAEICGRLSDANSPYDFDAIPIHILGSIYERFLGNVILAAGKRVQIVPRPEVRKAGGVYYTPEYIVSYIVENTVGRLIRGKTPEQIEALRFADIACGSGSFLLGIFETLLNYHGQYYNDNPRSARRGECVVHDGKLYLSLSKKRAILLKNIYGVDIDAQAVEVAQLSLYLRLLKEETPGTTHQHLLEFAHTAKLKKLLPDLSQNIRCGNSLIGRDILEGNLFAEDEDRKLNPINLEHAFPDITRSGGFDAIVGNPPYISMLLLDKNQAPTVKRYWKRIFQSAAGAFDIYLLFMERAITLVREGGYVSYIVPNKFLAAEYAVAFRAWLLLHCQLISLLDFSKVKVWPVSVYPVIPVLLKAPIDPKQKIEVSIATAAGLNNLEVLPAIPSRQLGSVPDNLWSFITQRGASVLLKIIHSSIPLEDVAEVWGASTVAEGSEYPTLLVEDENITPRTRAARFLVTGTIERYSTKWETNAVQFMHYSYKKPWIRLQSPMPVRRMEQARTPKLIISKVALEPRAFADTEGSFVGAYTTYVFPKQISLLVLTAIVNSRLMRFTYRLLYDALAMSGGYLRFQPPQIRRLPIRSFDPSDATGRRGAAELQEKAQAMIVAKQRLLAAVTHKDVAFFEGKCADLDRQIDAVVYRLYDLNRSEIAIIESQTQAEST